LYAGEVVAAAVWWGFSLQAAAGYTKYNKKQQQKHT
jgi:hypothetical protein